MQQLFGQKSRSITVAPIKPNKQLGFGCEGWEWPVCRAVWREVIAAAHLKARDYGELFGCPFAGHALTPGAILPPTASHLV
jgi:hypothetical protein